jgi:hypothetical protein
MAKESEFFWEIWGKFEEFLVFMGGFLRFFRG